MKIRNGFVSNSSSCSFLVLLDEKPNTEVDMKEYCAYHGSHHIGNLEDIKKLKNFADNLDKLPKDILDDAKDILKLATNNIRGIYFWKNTCKTIDTSDVWTPQMVAEELQREYEAGKGKEFHMEVDKDGDNLPMGSENWNIPEEQFMPFKDWIKDLKNPKGYFRRAIRDNIEKALTNRDIFTTDDCEMTIQYSDIRDIFDRWKWCEDNTKEYKDLNNMVEKITNEYIERILEEFGDCQAYFVHYVTDGESKNPFRYIAESCEPFKNFPLFIKYNNH